MLNKNRRQEMILQLLRGRTEESALSAIEINQKLNDEGIEIHLRTIRRDLEDLSMDYGLASTGEYPGSYYLSKDFHFSYKINFSEPQLQVLMIALNNLKNTSDQYFEKYATEVETLIFKNLPDQAAKELREDKDFYLYDYTLTGKPTSSNLVDFEKVMSALRERKVFSCENHSPYKTEEYNRKQRIFAPYRFILTSGIPYVLCLDMTDQQIKRLKLNRIQNVTIMNVDVNDDLKIDWSRFQNSIGGYGNFESEPIKMKILCDDQMALFFNERKIHKSQNLSQIGINRFELSFECELGYELIRLISSFGGHIHEIVPSELDKAVKEIWNNGMKKAA